MFTGKYVTIFYCIFVCVAKSVSGGRSFSFNLPGFPLNHGSQPPIKVFDGVRVKNDSMFMVYYHDLSVAVVELGPNKLLLKCNIIEIYSPNDIDAAMGPLIDKTTPVPVSFQQMVHLMNQCEKLDRMQIRHQINSSSHEEVHKNFTSRVLEAKETIANNLVLLSGIIPGTKWCGTGDIAKSYHDLGEDIATDMCCRKHDLCPVKIRSHSKKYDLSNDSIYTKSHCNCDDIFYSCMKEQSTRSALILANIYFNVVRVPCLQDGKEGRYFRDAKEF